MTDQDLAWLKHAASLDPRGACANIQAELARLAAANAELLAACEAMLATPLCRHCVGHNAAEWQQVREAVAKAKAASSSSLGSGLVVHSRLCSTCAIAALTSRMVSSE